MVDTVSSAPAPPPQLPFAYDPVLRRPGCVLLQAAFGGVGSLCHAFPVGSWLLTPTEGMRLFTATKQEWARVAQLPPPTAAQRRATRRCMARRKARA